MIVGGGLALFVAALSGAFVLKKSTVTVAESSAEVVPTGTIPEADTEFCRRLRFDDAGQAVQDVVPCGQSEVRDAHGRPVPLGTMHRLDAISKSFGGR